MRQIQIAKIRSLCQKRIHQVVSYQGADLIDELPGESITEVPTIGTYTIIFNGKAVECKDLYIDDTEVSCLRVDDMPRLNINILDEQALNVIAKKISDDIAKTEEWADKFFV